MEKNSTTPEEISALIERGKRLESMLRSKEIRWDNLTKHMQINVWRSQITDRRINSLQLAKVPIDDERFQQLMELREAENKNGDMLLQAILQIFEDHEPDEL